MAQSIDFTPSGRDLQKSLTDGLLGGGVGGLLVGMGSNFGVLGTALGGVLAGAMLSGDTGKIVTVNAIMDSVVSMFSPQQSTGGAGEVI